MSSLPGSIHYNSNPPRKIKEDGTLTNFPSISAIPRCSPSSRDSLSPIGYSIPRCLPPKGIASVPGYNPASPPAVQLPPWF